MKTNKIKKHIEYPRKSEGKKEAPLLLVPKESETTYLTPKQMQQLNDKTTSDHVANIASLKLKHL